MLSRFLLVILLPVMPLLLGCGSWGQLMIEHESEGYTLLTLCDAGYGLALPDCETLKARLEAGETLVVGDGWFNHSLARSDLTEWFERSQNSLVVNRISPGLFPNQWFVEVWLHQNGELKPVTEVFKQFTDEFWQILEESIFFEALYISDALHRSRRLPVPWTTLTPSQRRELTESPESQTLLELFRGNQLVFTGSLQIVHRITRGCGGDLDQVFPIIENKPPEASE